VRDRRRGRRPLTDLPLRHIVVVGASLAGLRACEELRARGFDGRVTLIGAENHLPYDRPPLSKQLLAGTWSIDRVTLRTPERLGELDLDLWLGTPAEGLDLARRVVTVGGGHLGRTEVPFDGLVVATGASARHLPGTPDGLQGLFTLRTLDDCLALSRLLEEPGARVVVIGAGFIGSEVASTASGRGAAVTVVEALAVPLERVLGEQMGRACASLHGDHGVRLLTGVGVEKVVADGTLRGVELADGTVLEADAVVVGVGVAPETAWLEGSGLQIADGVVAGESLLAAPGVAVAGDIARWHHRGLGRSLRIEHWENAAGQGMHAAGSLLAGEQRAEAFAPIPYFWSDQYGVKIQFVGDVQPGDEVVVVEGDVEERRFVACYGRDERLVGVLSFGRPRLLMEYRRLLALGASFAEALAAEPA
jgi:3-phenylpropionate/trans-cinnamate dioxygenase ferredoxin reductase component